MTVGSFRGKKAIKEFHPSIRDLHTMISFFVVKSV